MTRWSAKGWNNAADECGENCNKGNANMQGAHSTFDKASGGRRSRCWPSLMSACQMWHTESQNITSQTDKLETISWGAVDSIRLAVDTVSRQLLAWWRWRRNGNSSQRTAGWAPQDLAGGHDSVAFSPPLLSSFFLCSRSTTRAATRHDTLGRSAEIDDNAPASKLSHPPPPSFWHDEEKNHTGSRWWILNGDGETERYRLTSRAVYRGKCLHANTL